MNLPTKTTTDLTRTRIAVLALFFTNGALFANWAPRIPSVQDGLAINATMLGVALTGLGVGGLLFTLTAGTLVDRIGSRRVLLASTAALCAGLVLPALAPTWWALCLALVVLGAADAAMDVSMNAQGVLVEQRSGRPLLNGFHASWSVGAVAGGLVGTAAAAVRVPPAVHFLATGAVLGAVVLVVRQRLIDDEERAGALATGTKRRGGIGRPAPALLLLGLMVVFAAQIEDVPQSWSAVYLSDLGAGPGTAGLAFVAFSVFMTAGRLVGDRLVERLGPSVVVTGGGLLVALAFGVGLLVASPLATITGFALAGLGASPMFPVAFSMVGRLPGVLPGAGIATVSLVSRLGFLAAPLLVGGLVGVTTFQVALSVVVVAGLGAAALAPRLSRLQVPAGDASKQVD